MALTITVNGAGTFTASMEEGPVSFSASLGAIGPAGPGVAAGGTTGQILVKTTNADYATGWIDNAARSVFISGRNNTGSTIAKGAVVYLSGATGNKATIALAQANSEATSARTIGITKAEVANGADVDVVISGAIENIDTSAFSAGQVVYLSATVAGGLTTTLPTQPNHGVVVGIVTRSNANQGSIEVTVQNYQELKELSDVLVSNPQNGQALIYETSSGLWKNLAIPAPDLSAYLTSATAAATYQTIAGMSSYLTTSAASSTYAPIASPTFTGTVTIPAGASIDGYLTTASAASTYQPIGSYAVTNAGNTFSASQVIETTSTSAALRVTQLGTGEAFRVEDSANPDSTPFVITASGNVGIGVSTTSSNLEVLGRSYLRNTSSAGGNPLLWVRQESTGSGIVALQVTNEGSGASLRVDDVASDTTPFIVDAGGNVGVKTASPSTDLEVNGNAKFTTAEIVTAPAAGDSSSKVPTTAWVQAEVPAASTTVAGKVELATDAEAIAGTSTTLAVTPKGVDEAFLFPGRFLYTTAFGAATSGTGSLTGQTLQDAKFIGAPTSVVGYALLRSAGTLVQRGRAYNNGIDFSKRIVLAFRMALRTASTDANSLYRITLGKDTTDNAGDLGLRGFGIKGISGSPVVLTVHNGTTLTDVNSTFTPSGVNSFDVELLSDGAGNVTLYIDGSQVATTSAGPSNAGGTTDYQLQAEAENINTLTGTRMGYEIANLRVTYSL